MGGGQIFIVVHRVICDKPIVFVVRVQTTSWKPMKVKQDRRWNADKPSAALDPYIPTWLATSSANHRPANFWKSFFFLKHWKEIVKSGAISGWTDADQFQILSSHSLIFEVQIITYIIYQSIMGMLIIFTVCHSRCSYMIFSAAYLYRLLRWLIYIYLYIYSYIEFLHNILAIPPAVYPEMCNGTTSHLWYIVMIPGGR